MQNTKPEIIAENDIKRSEFIYKFFEKKNKINPAIEIEIPKVIVQYWHNLDQIPDDVNDCIKSWKVLKEKGFEFKLFDDSSAKKIYR